MKNTTLKVSDIKAEKNPMLLTELSPKTSTNVQGGGIGGSIIKLVVGELVVIAVEEVIERW